MYRQVLSISLIGFAVSFAHANDRMSFSCTGVDRATISIRLTLSSFSDGEAQGFEIERRGLFDPKIDQLVKTNQTIVKSSYRPSSAKYKGLEKYSLDTDKDESLVQPIYNWQTGKMVDTIDGSQYAFLVPPRTDLEKNWHSLSDKTTNGTFNAFLQVRYSGGDHFVVVPLICALGWKS